MEEGGKEHKVMSQEMTSLDSIGFRKTINPEEDRAQGIVQCTAGVDYNGFFQLCHKEERTQLRNGPQTLKRHLTSSKKMCWSQIASEATHRMLPENCTLEQN